MGNVNKVILVGNLGADPQLERTPTNQRPYCHLKLATDRVFKDKQGESRSETDWHRVTVWGETAEHCAQYLHKGSTIYVEGRLETRSWEDAGKKRFATDVVAIRVVFLDSPARQAA
jgi:single-strand DNA-binding protein